MAARDHIVKRSFDMIQPDVVLCGGIGEALFIAEMARLWSVQCVPHCWSGAIGIAATLQLLSLLPDATFGFSARSAAAGARPAGKPVPRRAGRDPLQDRCPRLRGNSHRPRTGNRNR